MWWLRLERQSSLTTVERQWGHVIAWTSEKSGNSARHHRLCFWDLFVLVSTINQYLASIPARLYTAIFGFDIANIQGTPYRLINLVNGVLGANSVLGAGRIWGPTTVVKSAKCAYRSGNLRLSRFHVMQEANIACTIHPVAKMYSVHPNLSKLTHESGG